MFDQQPEDIFSALEPTTSQPPRPTPPPAAPGPPPTAVRPTPPTPRPVMTPPPTSGVMEMSHEGDHKRWLWLVAAAVVVIIVVLAGWSAYSWWQSRANAPTFTPTNGTPSTVNTTPTGNNANPSMAVVPPRDSDLDGLTDVEEAGLGTNAQSADTDLDGLFDKEESQIYKTDPLNSDTDTDGYSDGEEVRGGYNPLGAGRLFATPPIQ